MPAGSRSKACLRGAPQVVDGDDVERRSAPREGDVGELGHRPITIPARDRFSPATYDSRCSEGRVLPFGLVATLLGCTDDTSKVEAPPPRLDDAVDKTLTAGPARLTATVSAGRVSLPPARTLGSDARLPGVRPDRRGPDGLPRAASGLAPGPQPAVRHAHGARPRLRATALLVRRPFAHSGAVRSATGARAPRTICTRPCSPSAAFRARHCVSDRPATIDFRAFDREPPRRDEDGWTLRPLLRRLGVRGIEVRGGTRTATSNAFAFSGRVRVELSLAGFGEEMRVPYARASSYE